MLIVGIAGGTGCGKTTVVNKLIAALGAGQIVLMPQDSYYRDNSHLPLEERQKLNFDHPDAIEWDLLIRHLNALKEGKTIPQPIYSYLTCTRSDETVEVRPKKVILVEGILILTHPGLRKLLDIKVFVDADPDDRLARVIHRDLLERDRSVEKVLERYENTVKPMHLEFIDPSKRYADLIIPQGGQNKVGIRVLASLIREHISNNR
ncbi:MAG: uridine kinase [Bacteroidales bacterium]|nr:uridine kinase [Bacteroidales bacterium]